MKRWGLKEIEERADLRTEVLDRGVGVTLGCCFQQEVLLLRILHELTTLNNNYEYESNEALRRRQNGY